MIRSMPMGADQSATVPKLLTVFHTCAAVEAFFQVPSEPSSGSFVSMQRPSRVNSRQHHRGHQACTHIGNRSWNDAARPDLHMGQWWQGVLRQHRSLPLLSLLSMVL